MDAIVTNREILKQYQALCDVLPKEMGEDVKKEIDKAFIVAYTAHDNTFRKSGDSYIVHPLNVARIVLEELHVQDAVAVIAALLHDVPEDTSVTLEDIAKEFGDEVAVIVEGLTKIKKELPWFEPKQACIFQDFLKSLHRDKRIILIKLADRLDNMRSLDFMYKSQQLRIATETKKLYVPIANRLGLNKVKTELEDLYLKTVEPDRYHAISQKLAKTLRQREQELDDFFAPIEQELKKHGLLFCYHKRAKSIFSISEKMENKNVSFEEIYDLMAVRIILDTNQEKVTCWQVYGIVTSLYIPNNNRKKDWVSIPKSNGYESLHITVLNQKQEWVEVQIRTKRMDRIATYGIAAHWRYKPDSAIEQRDPETGFDNWLDEISRLAQVGSDSVSMLDQLESGFSKNDEIYVFTEDCKTMHLFKGSTVLDFAINQLGKNGLYVCRAFVNDELVPISHVLENHDEVRVEIDLNIKPTVQAMQLVKTYKGLCIVQEFFREKREKDAARGKVMLDNILQSYGVSVDAEILEHLRDFVGEKTITHLLLGIADDHIKIDDVVRRFVHVLKQCPVVGDKPFFDKKKVFLIKQTNRDEYEIASCCKPVPGQNIFGEMLRNRKIRVHTALCETGKNILARYGGRIVETEWYNPSPVEVTFFVYFLEDKMMASAILGAINIFHVQSLFFHRNNNGTAHADIKVLIKDVREMNFFMDRLKDIKGVQDIVRNM